MKQTQKGNWHILGAGAQGLLWAAAFSRCGVNATLLQKPASAPLTELHYRNGPLQANYAVRSLPLPVTESVKWLLVTVKATELDNALQALGPAGADLELVVLLQNGIGADRIARRWLPAHTVIWLGSSTHGSFRTARNAVEHAGVGSIWLGPDRHHLPAAQHQAALASLQATDLNVQWDPQIQARLWHKLALNCCINPLTALLNCRNGELLQQPLAQRWLPLLAQEAAAVLTAEGHPISATKLLTDVQAIAERTAANYNSMQQDYQQQRPTEIDFITGSLIEAAARHGVSVPHHAELLTRVQQRQSFGV